MALWDFLKRKRKVEKEKEKSARKKASQKKVEEVSDAPKQEKKDKAGGPVARTAAPKKKAKGFSYEIVKEPHISEKSTNLAQSNKYVFKIYDKAGKSEIKKSIEGMYGVDVLSVNTVKISRKKRRLGRVEGFKKGYRKAIVTIKEGQSIEVL